MGHEQRQIAAFKRAQSAWDHRAEPEEADSSATLMEDGNGHSVEVVWAQTAGVCYVVGVMRDGCLCDTGYSPIDETQWTRQVQAQWDREEAGSFNN